MSKKSKSVAQSIPVAPVPKVPKIRLTKHMRDTLHRHMCDLFVQRLDRTEVEQILFPLVEKTNAILRAKYPEEDMPILRKYEMVRVDSCLKFTVPETGRFFGVNFSQPHILPTKAELVDIPCRGGCYNHEVYACDAAFEALADKWESQMNERYNLIRQKDREYSGFMQSCRYLEDVEAVVPISEEQRKALGAISRSLTVVNPDLIKSIKADFAIAA